MTSVEISANDGNDDDEHQIERVEFATKNDDIYEWNKRRLNLYDGTHDNLEDAFLMYCIPDMRTLAKRGELEGNAEMISRLVELPASALDVYILFKQNKQRLIDAALKDKERADFYESSLGLEKVADANKQEKESLLNMIEIDTYVDNDEENGCVYSIYLNHFNKRVNAHFRGSVTKQDFATDAKAVFGTIRNPIENGDELSDELGVHLGFRDYLYYGAERGEIVNDESNNKEGDQKVTTCKIILDRVRDLLAEHQGYRLYVGGHSLGGALATMLALEAVACSDITKDFPVTCITAGSPKVGNIDFMLAFEHLEKKNKLRCVHVANNRDPVTFSPPSTCAPFHACICQRRRYRHVGLSIYLRKNGYVIVYPPKTRSYGGILCCDQLQIFVTGVVFIVALATTVVCLIYCTYIAIPVGICCVFYSARQQRQHHTQLKYIRRFERNEESLRKLDIDGLNQERWDRLIWRWPVLRIHTNKRRKRIQHGDRGDRGNNRSNGAASKQDDKQEV